MLPLNNSNNYLIGVKFHKQRKKRKTVVSSTMFINGSLEVPKAGVPYQSQAVGAHPGWANPEEQDLRSSSRTLRGAITRYDMYPKVINQG